MSAKRSRRRLPATGTPLPSAVVSDRTTRMEKGRMLCKRAVADVAAIVPVGIGRWHRAWDITAVADVQFVQALDTWEASGTSVDRTRLGTAYEGFIESWRSAAGQFRLHQAGCTNAPVAIIEGGGGGQDFRIHSEDRNAGLRLDPARIASITEETRAVAGILKEVFDREEEPVPQATSPEAERGARPLGLDQPHSELLALLTRQPRWTAAALDQGGIPPGKHRPMGHDRVAVARRRAL